jgi:HK97 family phage major capsid protein
MRTITLDNFKTALQNAAAQKGADGVAHVKAVMLADCVVTDADGMPIDPANLDVVISPAAAAPGVEETDMTKPNAEEVAKAIRSEIRAAVADAGVAVRKGIVTNDLPNLPRAYGKSKSFGNAQDAYRFGRFLFAVAGNAKSADWCARNGINLKAHLETVNSAGGFLVPDEFEATLISLREKYGVMRANARVYPMGRDTLNIAVRKAGLTSYWAGETAAGTESTLTFGNCGLVAKKLFALTTASSELVEDAIVSVADTVADEIAQEFAYREDDAGFNGNGTNTYGGMVGLQNVLGSASVSDTAIGTGDISNTSTGVTLPLVAAWLAKLPAYGITPNTKIYCNKAVYHAVFERLAMTAGGTTATEIQNGASPRFFGYPVVFTQVMASAIATGTNDVDIAYVGDLSLGVAFGDRRATTIRTSDSALNAFEQDEIVIRGTQRVDIVCHSPGDSSTAGPIIALRR